MARRSRFIPCRLVHDGDRLGAIVYPVVIDGHEWRRGFLRPREGWALASPAKAGSAGSSLPPVLPLPHRLVASANQLDQGVDPLTAREAGCVDKSIG